MMTKILMLYGLLVPSLALRRVFPDVPGTPADLNKMDPKDQIDLGKDKDLEDLEYTDYENFNRSAEADYEIHYEMDELMGSKTLHSIIGNLKFAQDCPTTSPKVALCIVGMSRYFANPKQVQYFQTMMLEPLKAAGARGLASEKPDVFVHTKLGNVGPTARTRQEASHDKRNTRDNVMASVQEIGAVAYVVEDGTGPVLGRANLTNKNCFHPHDGGHGAGYGLLAAMSYHKSMNGCLELIKNAEAQHNETYDFVIHSRPDTSEIDHSKDTTKNAVQCQTSLIIRDSMSYHPRRNFDVFANVWNDQFQNPHPSQCGMSASQEHFVSEAVHKIHGRYIR
jgi:hypothetical protein